MVLTVKIGSGKPLFELPNDRFMDAAGVSLKRLPTTAPHDPRNPLPDHLGTDDWEDADQ